MKWMHKRVGSQSGQAQSQKQGEGTGRGLNWMWGYSTLPGRVVSGDYFRGLLGRWPCRIGGRQVARGWEGWDRLRGSCHCFGSSERTKTRVVTVGNDGDNSISHLTGFRERGRHQGTWVKMAPRLGVRMTAVKEAVATEQTERLEGRTGYLSAWECVGIFRMCRSRWIE